MTRHFNKENWFSKISWDPVSRIRTNFTFLYTPEYMTGALYPYDGFAPNTSSRALADALSEVSPEPQGPCAASCASPPPQRSPS
jgi:hypothetical protein